MGAGLVQPGEAAVSGGRINSQELHRVYLEDGSGFFTEVLRGEKGTMDIN